MDKIVEYFKANQTLAIILLVIAIILVICIVWAIIAACRKNTKLKNTAKSPSTENKTINSKSTASTVENTKHENEVTPSVDDEPKLIDNKMEKAAENPVQEEPEKPTAAVSSTPIPSNLSDSTAETQMPISETPEKRDKNKTEKKTTIKENTPPPKEKNPKIYAGKWVISASNTDENGISAYSFELRASNGEKLLSSVDYKSIQGAKNGIKTYKTNIEKNNFTVAQNKKGEYFFKLLNGSGHLLSTGEQYQSKSNCESAIDSVKRFSVTAVIVVEEKEF